MEEWEIQNIIDELDIIKKKVKELTKDLKATQEALSEEEDDDDDDDWDDEDDDEDEDDDDCAEGEDNDLEEGLFWDYEKKDKQIEE